MSYDPKADFVALTRLVSGGAVFERMPGLDWVVAALARAGMINLYSGQTAPTSRQPVTVWFRTASPSWTAEGAVLLWNSSTGAYSLATPKLWFALLRAASGVRLLEANNNLADLQDAAAARVNLGASVIGSGVFTSAGVGAALSALGAAQNYLMNGRLVETHSGGSATFSIKTLAGEDPSTADPVLAASAGGGVLEITAPLALTVSTGSTLGTASGVPFRLWFVVAIDSDGTAHLGVRNCATQNGLSGFPGSGFLSSAGEGGHGGANSAGVTYTDVALLSAPFAIVGFADYDVGLTTVGVWGASPTRIRYANGCVRKPGDVIQSKNVVGSASFTSSQVPVASGLTASISIGTVHNAVRVSFQGAGNTNAAGRALLVGLYRGASAVTTLLSGVAKVSSAAGALGAHVCLAPYVDFPRVAGAVGYTAGISNPASAAQVDFPVTTDGLTPMFLLEELMG